jgi:hypothetical protein
LHTLPSISRKYPRINSHRCGKPHAFAFGK